MMIMVKRFKLVIEIKKAKRWYRLAVLIKF